MREITLHSRVPRFAGLVALVDDLDFDIVDEFRWNITVGPQGKTHYAHGRIPGPRAGHRPKVLMHRLIAVEMGLLPNIDDPRVIDHIDRKGLNNRRANIRLADHSLNALNRSVRRVTAAGQFGTCGSRGVSATSSNKFRATICFNGKKYELGRFPTEEEAARAYDEALIAHWGRAECLRSKALNFP